MNQDRENSSSISYICPETLRKPNILLHTITAPPQHVRVTLSSLIQTPRIYLPSHIPRSPYHWCVEHIQLFFNFFPYFPTNIWMCDISCCLLGATSTDHNEYTWLARANITTYIISLIFGLSTMPRLDRIRTNADPESDQSNYSLLSLDVQIRYKDILSTYRLSPAVPCSG